VLHINAHKLNCISIFLNTTGDLSKETEGVIGNDIDTAILFYF
jgi:hypothetical protein